MVTTLVGSLTSAALGAIGTLHLYWAGGGAWGKGTVIPERDGRPLFRPTKGATTAVGSLLWLSAAVISGQVGLLGPLLPQGVTRLGAWFLAILFLARAVGDFRWVGFFKRHRGTRFARRDTMVFSPLCVALSLGCMLCALAREN